MEDFFGQFKKKLESRQEPEFDERLWRVVEQSLDREGGKRRPAGLAWWWVGLALLLLLLTANGWTLLELHRANERMAELEIRPDTVFIEKTIVLVDTVYHTEVIHERLLPSLPTFAFASGKTPAMQPTFPVPQNKNAAEQASFENTASLADKGNAPVGFSKNKTEGSENDLIKNTLASVPTLGLAALDYPSTPPLLASTKVESPDKKSFREVLEKKLHQARNALPNTFRLGPTATMLYPLTSEVDPVLGNSFGVSAHFQFPNELRMVADVQMGETGYETDRMDSDLGVPPVQPISDDFQFNLAEVSQPFLQFSFLLQYPFLKEKKTRPVAGLGLSTFRLRQYDISYEFSNPSIGAEWKNEVEVNDHLRVDNLMQVQLGFERRLGRHLLCQAMLTYQRGFSQEVRPVREMLGLQGGIFYEL